MDEIRQLREVREAQQQMIRNLEEQCAGWEEVATARLEILRELRIELGKHPDADDEREQL